MVVSRPLLALSGRANRADECALGGDSGHDAYVTRCLVMAQGGQGRCSTPCGMTMNSPGSRSISPVRRPMREASAHDLAQPLGVVRRPQVGELNKQIAVGPHSVPRHLPVCEDSQEGIGGIVGECPAIGWEGRRAPRADRQCDLVFRDHNRSPGRSGAWKSATSSSERAAYGRGPSREASEQAALRN